MAEENVAIVILGTYMEAENAVKELQRSSFDMKKISIVGKESHTEENVIGYFNTGDRVRFWGKQGVFWGGICSMLFGSAFFLVPGIGPLVVAGPLISVILAGLQGAVVIGGLSALGAGLYGIGIPRDSIPEYETALISEKYVLVVHGSTDELVQAGVILKNMGYVMKVHSVRAEARSAVPG